MPSVVETLETSIRFNERMLKRYPNDQHSLRKLEEAKQKLVVAQERAEQRRIKQLLAVCGITPP